MEEGQLIYLHHDLQNIHGLHFLQDTVILDIILNDYDFEKRRMTLFKRVSDSEVQIGTR